MPTSHYRLAAPVRFSTDRDGDLTPASGDPTYILQRAVHTDPVLMNIPPSQARRALRPHTSWLLWIAASAASFSFAATSLATLIVLVAFSR